MAKDSNDFQKEEQSSPPLFDDTQDLYVGHIDKASGWIQVRGDRLRARLWGEVLLYEDPDGKIRLRRVALYGALLDPLSEDPIGVLSLAGPLTGTTSPGPDGLIEGLHLRLHYEALSSELPPRYETEDAVFPQVEQIVASLTLAQESKPDELALLLEVSLDVSEWVDRKLDVVQGVELAPILLSFRRAGSEAPRGEPHQSLPSDCGPPSTDCPPAFKTVERWLPIKFVSFSTQALADVETICRTQIAGGPAGINGLCAVWRKKAALNLGVGTTIAEGDPDQKAKFSRLDRTQEYGLRKTGFASLTQVEVYLVDVLLDRPGGGMTYDSGWASAFCILDLGKAQHNGNLLAHELGHVLGLSHPGDPPCPGSPGSIMEATGGAGSNPNVNTLHNCRIFTGGCDSPLNPIVKVTAVSDCFHPDQV